MSEDRDGQTEGSEPGEGSGDLARFLGPLLHALAESLDVREIFARISVEARRLVPHDFLMLGLLSEDRLRVRVLALSGELPDVPGDVALTGPLRLATEREAYVVSGAQEAPGGSAITARIRFEGSPASQPIEMPMQPFFRELLRRGLRSYLRVPIHLRGGVLGGLVFCSASPEAYSTSDLAKARHVADCVALALAHQRLAEEEQRSTEAREKAARLEIRVKRLTEELETQGRHRVLGESRSWREVLGRASKVAPTEATVLLCGESGTGKEVVARFIHRASRRAEGPFVALNCAALPEQLLESELFGHEKGAFTGALAARAGKIEQASGGVLFLDEAGEMSPSVQAKFLRFLQEREYQRLGGSRTLQADVRVLAATNRDLKTAIARGNFREDLYYRLAVFDIDLPPLRDRHADIMTLAHAFLEEIGRSMGRPAAGIAREAEEKLTSYHWPGNVRELRNAIERAVILCEGGLIASEHLPLGVVAAPRRDAGDASSTSRSPSGPATLEAAEREMILQALARAGNNKSKAARLLGLTRAQLRSRIEKHRLTLETLSET
ncbi:MAG TPA: sigma 54-interacting transcriptional regulator [Candidatus Polarisedimenticolia bacterium]|jgi:transcriptional regulator with GAF, ATPase, and Fis domain|nr:sigma 54-interacting transcriptional regulator [Candidatus Polarisedimenticolia bacterium]